MEQSGTWVHKVARGKEEQLRGDEQELKVWEKKNDKNEVTHHVQDEIGKLMHND